MPKIEFQEQQPVGCGNPDCPACARHIPVDPAKKRAMDALLAKWKTRAYGQHAGYLGAREAVEIVMAALAAEPATHKE